MQTFSWQYVKTSSRNSVPDCQQTLAEAICMASWNADRRFWKTPCLMIFNFSIYSECKCLKNSVLKSKWLHIKSWLFGQIISIRFEIRLLDPLSVTFNSRWIPLNFLTLGLWIIPMQLGPYSNKKFIHIRFLMRSAAVHTYIWSFSIEPTNQ